MMNGGKFGKALDGFKPSIVMIFVQFAIAGVNVFYKLAAKDGMSLRIIIAYRLLFATAVITPIAFFLERKKRPKLTGKILFYAFLCGFFGGSFTMNTYVQSLVLTSTTFAAAMINLVPAVTFIMAVIFGLEKLDIKTIGGKGKVLGTLMGIGGAMFLTFYKGVEIQLWSTHINILNIGSQRHPNATNPQHHNTHDQFIGSLLAVLSCFSYASWLIVQAKMSECYPCHYSSTALMCLMGSIQSVGFALCFDRQYSHWKLGWNIRLLTVAYTGIVASGLMISLISWCVRLKGPLFVSVFNPVLLIIVALSGSLFMDEKLYLGSVIGGVLIIIGLYLVLWGKSRETQYCSQLTPSQSIEHQHGLVDILSNSSSSLPRSMSGVHCSSSIREQ